MKSLAHRRVRASILNRTATVPLFSTPWTVAFQAPLSMGFSRQEYWSVLPFPSPGDLPHPGIKSKSPALAGKFFITEMWLLSPSQVSLRRQDVKGNVSPCKTYRVSLMGRVALN